HYLVLAVEIDKPIPILKYFMGKSNKKKELIKDSKDNCIELEKIDGIINAIVFEALMIPPLRGNQYKSIEVKQARYDVVVLIEIKDQTYCNTILYNKIYLEMEE